MRQAGPQALLQAQQLLLRSCHITFDSISREEAAQSIAAELSQGNSPPTWRISTLPCHSASAREGPHVLATIHTASLKPSSSINFSLRRDSNVDGCLALDAVCLSAPAKSSSPGDNQKRPRGPPEYHSRARTQVPNLRYLIVTCDRAPGDKPILLPGASWAAQRPPPRHGVGAGASKMAAKRWPPRLRTYCKPYVRHALGKSSKNATTGRRFRLAVTAQPLATSVSGFTVYTRAIKRGRIRWVSSNKDCFAKWGDKVCHFEVESTTSWRRKYIRSAQTDTSCGRPI